MAQEHQAEVHLMHVLDTAGHEEPENTLVIVQCRQCLHIHRPQAAGGITEGSSLVVQVCQRRALRQSL